VRGRGIGGARAEERTVVAAHIDVGGGGGRRLSGGLPGTGRARALGSGLGAAAGRVAAAAWWLRREK
jgi:hypothetical protein